MTAEEIKKIQFQIMNESKIMLPYIYSCYENNIKIVDNFESIFDVKTKKEFLYLKTLIEIMGDSGDIPEEEALLQREHPEYNIDVQPDFTDKLMVVTAIFKNPKFFSIAWNWISYLEYSISNIMEYADAAATAGIHAFGKERKISGIGLLGMQFTNDNNEALFRFYIKTNPDCKKENTTVVVEYTCGDSSESHKTNICIQADSKYVYSEMLNIDARKGIKILKIEVKE